MSLLDTLEGRPRTSRNATRPNCHKCIKFEVKPLSSYPKDPRYRLPGTITEKVCQWGILENEFYCDKHLYLKNFTAEQRPYLRWCSTGKHYYLPDFEDPKLNITCPAHTPKYQLANAQRREERSQMTKCKWFNPFKNVKCDNLPQEGGYCGIHDTFNGFDLENLCWNFIKKCFNLKEPDNNFCQECFELESQITFITEDQMKSVGIGNSGDFQNIRFECINEKCKYVGKLVYFIDGNRNISPRCKWCRDINANAREKRPARLERYNRADLVNHVKKRARNINVPMELTDQEILLFMTSNCFYCGEIDETGYNNIDRIDNNKTIGYKSGNCVPCDWTCNRIKGDTFNSTEDFLKACMNINQKFGSTNKYCGDQCRHSYDSFNTFVNCNTSRGLDIEISEKDYHEILSNKCYYCDCLNHNILNIDRMDNSVHYVKSNCVSCCTICNMMKNELDFDFFRIQMEKITLNHHAKLQYGTLKKLPIIITREWLKEKLIKLSEFLKLSKNLTERDIYIDNRGSNYQPIHNEQFYKNLVYSFPNLTSFTPEIEFVEKDEQKDLWMYFRLKMSSLKQSKLVGHQVKMLIRDSATKKYIGIASLSSDIKTLGARDKYIGWTNDNKLEQNRINSILNLSTCVGLRPFCYNFNGGKLIAKLMFSQEVYDYVTRKYPNMKFVGILTTSINGKSIQYSRLPELKFIGYTRGYGTIHIPDIYLSAIEKYVEQNRIPLSAGEKRSKLYRLNKISQHLGLGDTLVNHGIERGVYFGYLCKNAQKYLCGEDSVDLVYNLKSIETIYQEWKSRWGIQRYNHLVSQNRLLLNVEFNPNCILRDCDLVRNRVRRHRANENFNTQRATNEEIQRNVCAIIRYLVVNPKLPSSRISELLNENDDIQLSHQSVGRIRKKYNLSLYAELL